MPRLTSGRTGTSARRLLFAAAPTAVCVALGFAASAAGATVTIGAPNISSDQIEESCGVCTYAQLTQPSAGVLLSAPAAGVITSWRVHGVTTGTGRLALRVLRPDPNGASPPDATTPFTGVGTSAPVTASGGDGSPAHPVSLPVQAGDYIGVDLNSTGPANLSSVDMTQPSGAIAANWSSPLADGSTLAPDTTEASERLMLNAVEVLAPVVSGVSPSSGSTAGGQTVTIAGSNLDGATEVSFGGTAAPSFTATATRITATAPAHTPATVDIEVTGPGGVSPVSGADLYSYLAPGVNPPSIAIASPIDSASYAQGQMVTAFYACAAPAGGTVTTCAGPVANSLPIDTSTPGSHTFTVMAQDSDGGSATKTVAYTVTALSPSPVVTPAPALSAASQTAKTWRENDTLARISAKRKPPVGTTFSFALNEPARVTLSFTHQVNGRRIHHKCVAAKAETRRTPRCTRTVIVGTLTFTGHPGTNQVRFAGRISPTKKLTPGKYAVIITARNARDMGSTPRSLTFTIVK